MDQAVVSFRPARDIRRARWISSVQLAVGVMWIVYGAWAVTADSPIQQALGGVLGVMALAMVVVYALGRRAGVEADGRGLRWRGMIRSAEYRWADVTRVVIEDRGNPYGSKVGVEVETADGARHAVPFDALAGLEEERHAELRRDLLASVAGSAEGAGVPVVTPGRDDPLVP